MSKNLSIMVSVDGNGNLTSVINQATGALSKMGNESERTFSKARKGVESISTQLNGVKNSFSTLFNAAAASASVYALTSLSDAYKAMQGQLTLVTDSAVEFAAVQQHLNVVAISAYADQTAVTKLYSAMQPALQGMGKSINEAVAFTETFNKALSLTSPTTQEAQSAVLQFAQAMGSGVLRGDEFNSLMENGRGIMVALAEGMGKPISELRKMAEAGELTADVVYNALSKVSDRIEVDFNKLPMTVGKANQTIQTGALNLGGAFDAAAGSSAQLAAAINSTGLAFNRIGDAIRQAYGESDEASKRFEFLEKIILQVARGGGFAVAVLNEFINQIGLISAIAASVGDDGVKIVSIFEAYQEAAL
jgi:tape measure domain-containing protein